MEKNVDFYISPTKLANEEYWDKESVEGCAEFNGNKSYFSGGFLNINDFRFPEYTRTFFGFFNKLHILASVVASDVGADIMPSCDNVCYVSKYDLSHSKKWMGFKRVVARLMKDRNLGRGIVVGRYMKSWLGAHDGDPMIDDACVTSPKSLCGLIESGEIIPVDGRGNVYPYSLTLHSILFPDFITIDETVVTNILSDEKSGILFRDEF